MASGDGVKINVAVPKDLREAMDRRNRAAALARSAATAAPDRTKPVSPQQSRPATPEMPTSIRIVEFDRDKGEAREIGRGGGGR